MWVYKIIRQKYEVNSSFKIHATITNCEWVGTRVLWYSSHIVICFVPVLVGVRVPVKATILNADFHCM